MVGVTLCDICYLNKCPKGNSGQCKEEVVTGLFPGSEGSLTLNGHLRAYFIGTKLLKLPSTEFLKLWPNPLSSPRPSSSVKRFKENDVDEGKLLYSRICAKCEGIVNEAIKLHQETVTLQKKIDRLGEVLFELRELGQQQRCQKRKSPSKSRRGPAEAMMNLSLACLGLAAPIKKVTTPEKSIKSSLRKRKPKRKVERDPLEEDPFEDEDTTVTTTEAYVEIKQEVDEENNELQRGKIGEQVESTLVSTEASEDFQDDENYFEGGNDDVAGDDDMDNDDAVGVDDPDEDEDYIPTESTDEELEDDDDDDYVPEDLNETDKNSRKKVSNEMEISDSESNKGDEYEEVIVEGDIRNLNFDLNPNRSEAKTTVYEFQCPECSKIFQSRSTLQSHTLIMHDFPTFYTCPKCPDLKFRAKRELVEHRKKVHGNTCEKCGKKLSKIDALIEHYKRVHKIKFIYTCPLCKEQFKTRYGIKKHRRKAHVPTAEDIIKMPPRAPKTEEEKMWVSNPCSECGKVFLSGRKLESHLVSAHEYKLSKQFRKENARKCYFCWKYFTLEQRHWLHRKLHHPDIPLEFPCIPCKEKNLVFQSTSELLAHFETEHALETIHTCKYCQWPFLDDQSLKKHKAGHVHKLPDQDEADAQKLLVCQFNCWFCWELFPTKEKLQRHLKVNTRHRKLKVEFPCDDQECARYKTPFSSVEELKIHLGDAHGDKELFTCTRCTWGFQSKDMLTYHELVHVPRRASQFKCPACDHISAKLPALQDHYNSRHGLNLKLWKCAECDDKFMTRIGRALHQTQKHERHKEIIDGIPCDKCGKMFRNEKILKSHQYQMHANLTCPECGILFQSNHKYVLHRKKEHNVGEHHLCQVCGKKFFERHVLLKHMAFHSDIRFECHLCGKMMMAEDTFRKHMKKVHKNEKPKPGPSQKFVCQECGKGYSRKDSLDDHVRVKHTQETYRVWECTLCKKRFKRQRDLDLHNANSGRACFERVTLAIEPTATDVAEVS